MTPAGASWGRPAQSPMAGTCSGVCGGVWRRWRSCGLVGMPNVGKSTLFNALTRTQAAQAANYPFCTIDPNVAVVDVPDARLDELARVAGSARSVPMRLELRDIAGLVKGASEGSGMGNEFLGHIRSTSCILQVVRCFDDDDVVHVEESVDPLRDIAIIENELVLADLESVERRVGDKKLAKAAAAGADSESVATLSLLRRCEALLAEGLPARDVLHTGDTLSSAELTLFHRLGLLTAKPVMVVCNVDEDAAASGNELSRAVQEWSAHRAAATTAAGDSSHCLVVSAKLEEEIANLDDEEARAEYLSEYGLQASGLDRVIQASTDLLGVHRFFTAGPQGEWEQVGSLPPPE